MSRIDRIHWQVLLRRMFREARRKGFTIEKTPYIGPGNQEGEEQLGRCYPRRRVQLVDGMDRQQEDVTFLHEMGHSQGGRSERIVETTAQNIYRRMSPSQRRKLRRFIPQDTDTVK